ncbi:hypothetical protein NC653_010582 [Populus alba x Populus x berolinensis]|uniref:Uncharacterized protein n=1 Tax=Populus alba x Populus x berolinensis TaxID=444605 RepID=A0AAD6R059_9ROSI|nr:hypothetical protein NC653_010582 [Populus alba x Populus x berolinensis]
MYSDFWTSRIVAPKRQYASQHHHQKKRPGLISHALTVKISISGLCVRNLKMSTPTTLKLPKEFSELSNPSPVYRKFRVKSTDERLASALSLQACPICSGHAKSYYIATWTLRHRRLCRVSIPNSQALSLLGRDLYDAHLQVLLGDGEEISKSVATSVEDSSARNAAPSHMWKSSFQYLSEESASQPAGLRKSKMPLSVFFRDARFFRIRASVSARESLSSGGSTVLSFMTFNVGRNGCAHLGVVSYSLQGIKQGTMLASWTGPDNSDVKEIKGKIANPMKNPRNKRREEVSNF